MLIDFCGLFTILAFLVLSLDYIRGVITSCFFTTFWDDQWLNPLCLSTLDRLFLDDQSTKGP